MKLTLLKGTFIALSLSLSSFNALADVEQNPVDCSTAKDDIAHLKHEKKSTDEREVKGVFSILPIGLVINAAHEAATSDTPKEMEIKKYNKKISERITDIQQKCNIQ